MRVDGILFDKDGTLFDFRATWDTWAAGLIQDLSKGDAAIQASLAKEMRFDLATLRFQADSPIIAGTNRQAAECVARGLQSDQIEAVEQILMEAGARAPLVPAVPLEPYLDGLHSLGLRLGVVTNDTEFGARSHLTKANVFEKFDFVAGFDSGYGAKPDAGPLLAFAKAYDLDPARVAMVGDSVHDLHAAHNAGMIAVGVLTGIAEHDELAPHADVIFPNIGHLTDWAR